MRDMHKWKDKVEVALDNRQIFFLFFGLSVVGCFVFALGVMVGRRSMDGPLVAAEGQDSLELLDRDDALAAGPDAVEGEFTFMEGLARPATEGLPETRDPAIPPRTKKEIEAGVPPKKPVKSEKPAKLEDKPEARKRTIPRAAPPAAKPEPKVSKPSDKKPERKPVPTAIVEEPAAKESAKKDDKVLAAAGDKPHKAIAKRTFTLQMKAFSKQEDAEGLARKLRSNGHDVRVESAEIRGRTWHRVRVGSFDDWDAALKAKEEFETREQIIAYVVRQ